MSRPADAKVAIECVVNPDGRVGTTRVTDSPNPTLNDAAMRALRQWQFKPGTKSGQPVAVRISVEISVERL